MKKFLALLSIAFVLITPAFAQYGLDETAGAANLKGESEPTVIVGRIIGAGLSLIGIVFFILTLYAGIIWMVARGNEDQAKKAINTIIAAAIGMIITMSAYAITSFILEAADRSALGSGGGGAAVVASEENIGTTETVCGSSKCTNQQQCVDGACIDNCKADSGSDLSCMARSECGASPVILGKCPGGTDWVCCNTP